MNIRERKELEVCQEFKVEVSGDLAETAPSAGSYVHYCLLVRAQMEGTSHVLGRILKVAPHQKE